MMTNFSQLVISFNKQIIVFSAINDLPHKKFLFQVVLVDPYRFNSIVLKEHAVVEVDATGESRNDNEYNLYHAKFVLYNQASE